jgi:hypothetical protein
MYFRVLQIRPNILPIKIAAQTHVSPHKPVHVVVLSKFKFFLNKNQNIFRYSQGNSITFSQAELHVRPNITSWPYRYEAK